MTAKRSPTSLAFRLNATLFFRQLRTLLWLDIVICALYAAGLFYYTETAAFTYLAEYRASAPAPSEVRGAGRNTGSGSAGANREREEGQILREDYDRVIYWTEEQPRVLYLFDEFGAYIPRKLLDELPDSIAGKEAGRWLYHGDWRLYRQDQTESLIYLIAIDSDGGWLVAETHLGSAVTIFVRCLMVILILEAITILNTSRRNSRSIKRTLKPLQELTASTQALTAMGGRLSPEALKRLTGALDSINVSHLDARLPLSGISNELKPLAEAINEMLSRIDEAYRAQIRFVSDASHELRTPIAVIQGYADILSRWGTEDPETMKESIAAIRQEAEDMKEMIEQLLFLARGESGFEGSEWKVVDLSALGAEVLRELDMIDEHHQFTAEITPSVTTEGDGGMLKQLMRILMDNSIKYTPAGGVILLRIESRGGKALVIVQDEGAGIPEAALPHIFDRFYRADESRTRETGGAGLGLSIARWIAQRHHGAIEVMSRENIGTRMTVTLPLRGAHPDGDN